MSNAGKCGGSRNAVREAIQRRRVRRNEKGRCKSCAMLLVVLDAYEFVTAPSVAWSPIVPLTNALPNAPQDTRLATVKQEAR
jgi:hypothetical protein